MNSMFTDAKLFAEWLEARIAYCDVQYSQEVSVDIKMYWKGRMTAFKDVLHELRG